MRTRKLTFSYLVVLLSCIHHANAFTCVPRAKIMRPVAHIPASIQHPQSFSSSSTDLYSSTTDEVTDKNDASTDRLLGILVLLTVPLSWGTYAPVVKYVYEMDPPLPGFAFSAGYYLVASVTLTFLSIMMNSSTSTDQSQAVFQPNADDDEEYSSNKLSLQSIAGLELGSYLFIGNCLQVVGLKTIPADRGAFLVQLTTIMVPLLQAAFAGNFGSIAVNTWLACILAFSGVIIMGLDQSSDVEILNSMSSLTEGLSFSGGDILIILAAISYSMHVIRLGRYAKFTSPIGLAASKATVEAGLSILLVGGLLATSASTNIAFINDMSTELSTYFSQVQTAIDTGDFPPSGSGKALGACLWTGWVTCAYTIYAQSFGQRRVEPTDANLIYTMQPIFSAMFAYFLLGETLGTYGKIGASMIGFGLYLANSPSDDKKEA